MKNKTEQVEIMTKALISRCHGLYSQEALGNEIMDFADRVVKLLTTPDVSKCGSIERETSCKHSDWIDLYYSSGDIYGRYCMDCGEFFE